MKVILPTLTAGTAMCAVIDIWCRHLYNNRGSTELELTTDVAALEYKIRTLPLAREHKRLLLRFLRPEVEYLDHWLKNFQSSIKDTDDSASQWLNKINLPENIRTNILGNIDVQATAKEILTSGRLNDGDAFRLTCFSFLEEEALLLWPRVKSYFLRRVVHPICMDNEEDSVIFFTRRFNDKYWAKDRKVILYDSASWCEYRLEWAVKAGNTAEVDYLFKKIQHADKGRIAEGILLKVFKEVFYGIEPHNAMMISLAVSHLETQRWHAFCEKEARLIFEYCTKWPMWLFFSKMILEARNYLSANELLEVLHKLAKSVSPMQCELALSMSLENDRNNQVAAILNDIWVDTSPRQKTYIINIMLMDDCPVPQFQKLFTEAKNPMFVQLVNDLFKDSTSLLAFLRDGYLKNICCLRNFLQKYFPSKSDSDKVRDMLSL